jgi:hypothetical protein
MFKQALRDHFVNAGLNPDNMEKDHIDAYFAAVSASEDAYLPDVSVRAIDRASDTLSFVAAENPAQPVALTRFEQPTQTFLVASFLWQDLVRVDLLFPFSPSFDGTVWVTASSASQFIHNFLYVSNESGGSVTAVEADPPEWASDGFVLLIGLPASGSVVADENTVFDETAAAAGEIQRAAASVYGHHMLNQYDLSDDERSALMMLLGATVAGKTVSMASLLAVGAMNPFASDEALTLRSTSPGTVIMGSNAIVGPFVKLTADN